MLTLYYHGHDHYRVPAEGFAEPRPIGYANEDSKAGVELTARPPRIASYERALKLEILEDLVLPYEWAQESDWLWRMFRVPAALLNGVMGYGKAADVRSIGVNGSV